MKNNKKTTYIIILSLLLILLVSCKTEDKGTAITENFLDLYLHQARYDKDEWENVKKEYSGENEEEIMNWAASWQEYLSYGQFNSLVNDGLLPNFEFEKIEVSTKLQTLEEVEQNKEYKAIVKIDDETVELNIKLNEDEKIDYINLEKIQEILNKKIEEKTAE